MGASYRSLAAGIALASSLYAAEALAQARPRPRPHRAVPDTLFVREFQNGQPYEVHTLPATLQASITGQCQSFVFYHLTHRTTTPVLDSVQVRTSGALARALVHGPRQVGHVEWHETPALGTTPYTVAVGNRRSTVTFNATNEPLSCDYVTTHFTVPQVAMRGIDWHHAFAANRPVLHQFVWTARNYNALRRVMDALRIPTPAYGNVQFMFQHEPGHKPNKPSAPITALRSPIPLTSLHGETVLQQAETGLIIGVGVTSTNEDRHAGLTGKLLARIHIAGSTLDGALSAYHNDWNGVTWQASATLRKPLSEHVQLLGRIEGADETFGTLTPLLGLGAKSGKVEFSVFGGTQYRTARHSIPADTAADRDLEYTLQGEVRLAGMSGKSFDITLNGALLSGGLHAPGQRTNEGMANLQVISPQVHIAGIPLRAFAQASTGTGPNPSTLQVLSGPKRSVSVGIALQP